MNIQHRETAGQTTARRGLDKSAIFLYVAVVASAIGLVILAFRSDAGQDRTLGRTAELKLNKIPFDGRRAFAMLEAICDIGPRVAGTDGMRRQQEMLTKHFRNLGGNVTLQSFEATHPETGKPVELANLIVEWHPERKERILLSAHYDTRPFPDQDPNPAKRRGVFLGANDGASGAALLAEMAYHMPKLDKNFGVDFVLFDAEELVYDDRRDEYFLGSQHFAREYVKQRSTGHRYRYAVNVDMIADRDLQIPQDPFSLSWPDSRPLVQSIWRTARRLGVREFVPREGPMVRDDHIPLYEIGGIPACNLIDFQYGPPGRSYWHTTHDTPDKCSPLSLAKVGWVLLTWLQELD